MGLSTAPEKVMFASTSPAIASPCAPVRIGARSVTKLGSPAKAVTGVRGMVMLPLSGACRRDERRRSG